MGEEEDVAPEAAAPADQAADGQPSDAADAADAAGAVARALSEALPGALSDALPQALGEALPAPLDAGELAESVAASVSESVGDPSPGDAPGAWDSQSVSDCLSALACLNVTAVFLLAALLADVGVRLGAVFAARMR